MIGSVAPPAHVIELEACEPVESEGSESGVGFDSWDIGRYESFSDRLLAPWCSAGNGTCKPDFDLDFEFGSSPELEGDELEVGLKSLDFDAVAEVVVAAEGSSSLNFHTSHNLLKIIYFHKCKSNKPNVGAVAVEWVLAEEEELVLGLHKLHILEPQWDCQAYNVDSPTVT